MSYAGPFSSGPARDYTTRDRWANWLAFGATVFALFLGLMIRDGVVNATIIYEDPEAGIQAVRPAGWLVDKESDDYVFRLRDPEARPFKTALQVTLLTIGPDATARSVLDALTLRRSARLSGYRVLDIFEAQTAAGVVPEMTYAYVESESDPFLATLPVVVKGIDVVFFKSNQAIVASYLASTDDFDRYYYHFEQFVASLRY